MPVPLFSARTAAFGTTAPEVSRTLPLSSASCAHASGAISRAVKQQCHPGCFTFPSSFGIRNSTAVQAGASEWAHTGTPMRCTGLFRMQCWFSLANFAGAAARDFDSLSGFWNPQMNRRTFLASSTALLAAPAAAAPPKRIAAIITEYWLGSHADVVIGNYLEGYNQDDQPPYPRSKIVAMFTEHVPKNDMSRPMAKKYGVPIFRTVQEALMLGGDKLAVDGVILIGEHGDYPVNDKGQTLYPRFEMFLKITDVFRQSGRSVPVFNDKHLSYSWRQARRMVEISKELKFSMLAGSSVPVAYRVPAIDTPFGAAQKYAVAISYSGLDIYGFHVLEALQCLVERRRGGESGVRSVQCLEEQACWNFIEHNGWVKRLFEEALTHSKTRKPGAPRDLVKEPAVFVLEYNDGLRAAAF